MSRFVRRLTVALALAGAATGAPLHARQGPAAQSGTLPQVVGHALARLVRTGRQLILLW